MIHVKLLLSGNSGHLSERRKCNPVQSAAVSNSASGLSLGAGFLGGETPCREIFSLSHPGHSQLPGEGQIVKSAAQNRLNESRTDFLLSTLPSGCYSFDLDNFLLSYFKGIKKIPLGVVQVAVAHTIGAQLQFRIRLTGAGYYLQH